MKTKIAPLLDAALYGAITIFLAVYFIGVAAGAWPQLPPNQKSRMTPLPPQPCCNITSMDAATGMVTAKVKSTGRTFQFKVADATLLSSLKTGQAVYANFKAQQVSVDGATPCCNIVSLAKGGVGNTAFGQNLGTAVNPGTPCCEIASIDAATGVVTGKVSATGQSFQFKVSDAALLNSLKTGQTVYANFKTQQVSVDGAEPCCNIVSLAKGSGVGNTAFGQNLGSTVNPGTPCCQITSINRVGPIDGIVTAKVNATGQTFQFRVTGGALLNSLKVGQGLFANFQTKQVSLDSKAVCCEIVFLSNTTTGPTLQPSAPSAPTNGASPSGGRPQEAAYRQVDPCTIASPASLQALLQSGIQGYFPVAVDNGGEHIRITNPTVEQVICPHMVMKVHTDFGYEQTRGFPQFQTGGSMELQSSLVVNVTFTGGVRATESAPITAGNFVRATAVLSNPQVTSVQIQNVPSWVDLTFVADCLNGKYSNLGCTDILHAMSFDVTALVKLYLDQGNTIPANSQAQPSLSQSPITSGTGKGFLQPSGALAPVPSVSKGDSEAVVTRIDSQSGLITAQDQANGRQFCFVSSSPDLLKVGDKVNVDKIRRQVFRAGSQPVGAIVPGVFARLPASISQLALRFAPEIHVKLLAGAASQANKTQPRQSLPKEDQSSTLSAPPSTNQAPAPMLPSSATHKFLTFDAPSPCGHYLGAWFWFAGPSQYNRQVVGACSDASGNGQYFIGSLPLRRIQVIDIPSGPTGINDRGQVVGLTMDDNYVFHGFVKNLSDGSLAMLDDPNASLDWVAGTFAMAINNKGQVVGSYVNSGDWQTPVHGFVESGGQFTTIDFPGAFATNPSAINDQGEIVGLFMANSSFPLTWHLFWYNPAGGGGPDSFERKANFVEIKGFDLSIPSSPSINNASEILDSLQNELGGTSHCVVGVNAGMNSRFKVLDVPSGVNPWCTGLDRLGSVAGGWISADDYEHGFLAIPITAAKSAP